MRTILIVEDSETCAETLQIALESMPGLKTMVLPSLAAALAALRSSDNDIAALVTDLHMPRQGRLRADSSASCRSSLCQSARPSDFGRQRSATSPTRAGPRRECVLLETVFTGGGAPQTGATSMLIRTLGISLACLCLTGAARAQSTPGPGQTRSSDDMQRVMDRLDRLEKQNQELLTEIQDLRRQLAPTLTSSTPGQRRHRLLETRPLL